LRLCLRKRAPAATSPRRMPYRARPPVGRSTSAPFDPSSMPFAAGRAGPMQACFRARPALQGRKLPDEPAPL